MKGLLVKDFRFLLGQKSSFLVFIGIGLYFLLTGVDVSFAMIFTVMMASIVATSSISYDNFDNGMAFLLTLPIQKKTYVLSKYILSLLVVLVMGGVIILLAVIGANMGMEHLNLTDLKGALVVAGVFATVLLAFMIPIYIIFGGEKARVAMIAVYGIAAAIVLLVKALVGDVEAAANELFAKLSALSNWQLALLGVGIMVVLLAVSMIISMIGLEKKEY
ncbi:MAG: ABC-2 transporter permease [Lachnospiraceae bacterium]|nr:ABC-2 transporter permease [Lachnospiraceae bacterium]